MRRVAFAVLLASSCVASSPSERPGATAEANTCATGTTLEGVDVSVYDQTVDWTQVKASGRAFAIAKATEGTSVTDGEFATNWPAMKAAGVVRSAYHFFHCDVTPAAQASFFLGVMGKLQPGDLPPSLDFEDTTTCTPASGVAMAVEWLDAVAKATGTLPLLYTSVNVLSSFDNTEQLTGHAQLWVASRGVTCPNLPAPFTAWTLWQYSLTGTAPGLPASNGMADLDRFNGGMSALLALTVGGSASAGASTSSGGGGPPSCTVGAEVGTCIDTSVCATMAGYESTPGLCPGPASERCCTKVPGASSASSGGAPGHGGAGGQGGARSSSASSSSRSSASSTSMGPSGAGGSPGEAGAPGASSGCTVPASGSSSWGALVGLSLLGWAGTRRRRGPAR